MLIDYSINIGNFKDILVVKRRPLTSIAILGLSCYESSPKKGKEKHTSDIINKIKPNATLLKHIIVFFKINAFTK